MTNARHPTCWNRQNLLDILRPPFIFNDRPIAFFKSTNIANDNEMADNTPVGIDSLPEEISDQIIRGIPLVDLPNVMLTSRAFWRQARPYLYKSVHYTSRNRHFKLPSPFFSIQQSLGNFDPTQSACIVQPNKFLRTISDNPSLTSRVAEFSFSIHESGDDEEVKVLKKCLHILQPVFLHLTLAPFQMKLALSHPVTSLDIMYPKEKALSTWQEMDPRFNFLREKIYALFTIPTLLHLTLRGARKWNVFSRVPTYPQYAGTSNIVSLSLPDTVPMDIDLQEILTWPKALKYYHHESEEGYRSRFQFGGGGYIASPKYFLESLAAQRDSLEELIYNHGEDCCGDDGTVFDPDLMRGFADLKYLSVPRQCFVDECGMPNPIYAALPPKLEILMMDQDAWLGDLEYEARLKGWLQEILDYKTARFPFLRSITLMESRAEARDVKKFPGTIEVLERISSGLALQDAQVQLDLILY